MRQIFPFVNGVCEKFINFFLRRKIPRERRASCGDYNPSGAGMQRSFQIFSPPRRMISPPRDILFFGPAKRRPAGLETNAAPGRCRSVRSPGSGRRRMATHRPGREKRRRCGAAAPRPETIFGPSAGSIWKTHMHGKSESFRRGGDRAAAGKGNPPRPPVPAWIACASCALRALAGLSFLFLKEKEPKRTLISLRARIWVTAALICFPFRCAQAQRKTASPPAK